MPVVAVVVPVAVVDVLVLLVGVCVVEVVKLAFVLLADELLFTT